MAHIFKEQIFALITQVVLLCQGDVAMFDTVLIPIYMVGLGSVQITALLKVQPLSQFPVQILFTLVCQNVPIQQFVTSS